MAANKITKEEYLDKDFDYSKLTKPELRQIMSENNVEDIPPLTALKSVILESYKKNIYDRIDYLKNNFSTENPFQSQRKRRVSESPAKNVPFTNVWDSSNPKPEHNKIEVRISNSKLNDSFSRDPCSEDVTEAASNASELNSTSFASLKTHKKAPGTVRQKKDGTEQFKNAAKPEKIPCAKVRHFKSKLLLSFFLLFCIYCKFFCPYCKPGMKFCINTPPHSRLVNNELVCDKGYRLVRGIVSICVLDDKKEVDLSYKADSIIRMLEYLKGDFKYGFTKSDKVKLSVLTSDEKLISKLAESSRVVIEDGMAQAVSYKVSSKVFMKFYFFFLLKISGIIFLSAVLIKLMLNRRRQAHALKQQAVSISKDVLDILNKQVVISLKSSQFRGYVYEEQMKDALEIKDNLWPYVKSIVEKNSNIQKETDEDGKVFWKWIGPVMIRGELLE